VTAGGDLSGIGHAEVIGRSAVRASEMLCTHEGANDQLGGNRNLTILVGVDQLPTTERPAKDRVLRHPSQYWGWLLLFAAVIFSLIMAGILLNRRLTAATTA
jgi:hypothetical protein